MRVRVHTGSVYYVLFLAAVNVINKGYGIGKLIVECNILKYNSISRGFGGIRSPRRFS